ncbi:MAG TPA: response regulator [Oscillatoriaceae cyanobacterium M33_DOE_052]|uniref:Response regulator n=1 Tax=Planktothricoides sp. SpSt-374 TaxID=2282167 RepID=A0A7C3ZMW0_9CYAN|nr:response regulator [Oscillatoriaceae cyanobacterium M33_DOE_052]
MVSEPPLVLVVDDDRSIRTLLRVAMEEEGYRVTDATNGEQGVKEFIRKQPDLVLLDGVMPVLDGFACCRQLRELPLGQDVPILMITVLDDPESVDQAFDCGATDYVTKPLHWAVLAQRVRRLLANRTVNSRMRDLEATLVRQTAREQLWRHWLQRLVFGNDGEDINLCLEELKVFLEVDQVEFIPWNPHSGANFLSFAFPHPWPLQELLSELQKSELVAIPDIKTAPLPAQVVDNCQMLNIQALLMAPVIQRQNTSAPVSGVVAAVHSQSRDWETEAMDLVRQMAHLLALA